MLNDILAQYVPEYEMLNAQSVWRRSRAFVRYLQHPNHLIKLSVRSFIRFFVPVLVPVLAKPIESSCALIRRVKKRV